MGLGATQLAGDLCRGEEFDCLAFAHGVLLLKRSGAHAVSVGATGTSASRPSRRTVGYSCHSLPSSKWPAACFPSLRKPVYGGVVRYSPSAIGPHSPHCLKWNGGRSRRANT